MKIIKLNKGYESIIDDELHEELSTVKWFYNKPNRVLSNKFGFMHRYIMKDEIKIYSNETGIPINKIQIDHINRNSLDNRKCNLRICNNQFNNFNKEKYITNNTGFKGVMKFKGKYVAQISYFGKNKRIGTYDKVEEAAIAYDVFALTYNPEFAFTNFTGYTNEYITNKYDEINDIILNKNNTSGYRGVFKYENNYSAVFIKDKRRYYLGVFSNLKDAAYAYNKKAYEILGSKAKLNDLE
jgi:hypothetical protein